MSSAKAAMEDMEALVHLPIIWLYEMTLKEKELRNVDNTTLISSHKGHSLPQNGLIINAVETREHSAARMPHYVSFCSETFKNSS